MTWVERAEPVPVFVNMTLAGFRSRKWAVDGLTESMRYELSTLGIDVVAVEPGFFHTNLFLRATRSSDIARANDYGETAAIPERLLPAFDQLFESQPVETDPRILVTAIGALLDAAPGTRPLRTCVGMDVGVRQLSAPRLRVRTPVLPPARRLPTPASSCWKPSCSRIDAKTSSPR